MPNLLKQLTRGLAAAAFLSATACGDSTPTELVPVTGAAAIAARFRDIAPRVGGLASIGLSLASQSLAFGASPSQVTVTPTMRRVIDQAVRAQIAASGTAATYSAVGMEMVVTNLPGTSAPVNATGIVTFRDETDFTYVMTVSGPDVGEPQAFGGIAQGGGFWVAPALAQAPSIARTSLGATCPTLPGNLPGYTCKLAQFSASFSIADAAPLAVPGYTTPSGTRSASMPASTVNGVSMTVDASKGGVY